MREQETEMSRKIRYVIATLLAFPLAMGLAGAQQTAIAPGIAPPAVIDENALFGTEKDIVTVIDPNVAATTDVQLVKDTKTYPVFLLSGTAGAGLSGRYSQSASNPLSIAGAVKLSSLGFDMLPTKSTHFSLTTSMLADPSGINAVSVKAAANLRAEDLVRLYIGGSANYDPDSFLSTASYEDLTLKLDELFLDTDIEKKVFFRLGKQRISWGVGNWYKPSDVLSLAAIDPDNPSAEREGPFAFKIDVPQKLNHAMLYLVPPVSSDPGAFSAAARYDLVTSGWELSFAGFGRTDMAVRPRLMFSATGAVGAFDVYGEQVALYGSDRTYVREKTGGGYETYRREDEFFFQSTLGIKYSKSLSSGLSYSLHVQGYYNGTGYSDASILLVDAARKAVEKSSTYRSSDLTQTGMWYLAGSGSLSFRFGEGKGLTVVTLSGYALADFSDSSVRFNPSCKVQVGDEGARTTLSLSALTSLGLRNSEYAKNGNKTEPALTLSVMNRLSVQVSTPLELNPDFSIKKVSTTFSVFWNAVSFD